MIDIEPTKYVPGNREPLDEEIMEELGIIYDNNNRGTVPFFGGHPVSVTKKDEKEIFEAGSSRPIEGRRQSPYLVCEKTDGVRYLLIVTNEGHFLISREGNKNLVAYRAYINIASDWQRNPSSYEDPYKPQKKWFGKVIHILDGEMINDKQKDGRYKLKYLIFDALVIFNKRIIDLPLYRRLYHCYKFIRCNEYILSMNPPQNSSPYSIDICLKDFFRLTCNNYATSETMKKYKLPHQPTTIEFLKNFYIPALPHENDGIIFNHDEKPYILGVNNGYLKFKPAEMNTIDFLIVPNTKFDGELTNRILDLYLGWKDEETKIYLMMFYNFTVISEQTFKDIEDAFDKKFEMAYKENPDSVSEDNFGIIAECNFDRVEMGSEESRIFREILSSTKDPREIHEMIMRPKNERKELYIIKKIQGEPCTKFWKIYRVRDDKNMPNDYKVATKIYQSIRDDIKYSDLIRNNEKLMGYLN